MNSRIVCQVEVIDETASLDLDTLARLCGLEVAVVHSLVEAGALQPLQGTAEWRFDGLQLGRARRAQRLHRDFEASVPAVALMLDLLDRIEWLEGQMRA